MTVHEVSRLTGVSVRTLHYYDKIGLLHPTAVSEAGYRLYDDTALERMQQILLFRELEFPLKEIKAILDSEGFDRRKALEQQIELLTLRKEHLENLITFARGIKLTGVKHMDFTAFDTTKIDEYARQAKEAWGTTKEYREFEEKAKRRSPEEEKQMLTDFMEIFRNFGAMMGQEPSAPQVQAQVKVLQEYITEHFYHCTSEILSGLGKMYSGGGEFTENIDGIGGEGTAAFTEAAIRGYVGGEEA